MATIKQKHDRLNYDTDAKNKQLIFPSDLMNSTEYAPFVVSLTPNVIRGHNTSTTLKLGNPKNTVGGDDLTVSAQTEVGTGSVRSQKDFLSLYNNTGAYTSTQERIVFPMPNQYNVSDAASWQTVDMGALGRGLDGFNSIKDFLGSGDTEGLKVFAEQMIVRGAVRGAAALASEVAKVAGSQLNALEYIQLQSGMSQNNYSEMMFKGMTNRTLPLNYTFAPRNLKEAQILQSIIHRLRYHLRPEFNFENGNAAYLLHPSTFDINFYKINPDGSVVTNEWTAKFSTCALTQLSVNGTPNGEFAVTKDGQFVAVAIDMLFTEIITHGKENTQDPRDSF